MSRSSATPTLLVFTLGPECEQSRRRILPGPLQEAAHLLHLHGLRGAIAAGVEAGFRVVVASPNPLDLPAGIEHLEQRGRGFAERLRMAIRSVQTSSAGAPLLVVGTDSPDLDVHHLRAAVELLGDSLRDVVLGPSRDGGFYLLASRGSLDVELADVRWCRRDTRASLERALRHHGRRILRLQPLRDLDRSADVELWLAARTPPSGPAWLQRLLSRLLAVWRRPIVQPNIGRPESVLAMVMSGRGPPS